MTMVHSLSLKSRLLEPFDRTFLRVPRLSPSQRTHPWSPFTDSWGSPVETFPSSMFHVKHSDGLNINVTSSSARTRYDLARVLRYGPAPASPRAVARAQLRRQNHQSHASSPSKRFRYISRTRGLLAFLPATANVLFKTHESGAQNRSAGAPRRPASELLVEDATFNNLFSLLIGIQSSSGLRNSVGHLYRDTGTLRWQLDAPDINRAGTSPTTRF